MLQKYKNAAKESVSYLCITKDRYFHPFASL